MHNINTILSHQSIKESSFILPRYIVVSLVSFIVGTFVLWALTDVMHLFYLFSAIFGALVSIIIDFVFNETWTFSHRRQAGLIKTSLSNRFIKHLSSKVIGLAIALSVLTLGTQVFGIHYLISNLMGIAASFLWNYAMSYMWVWARNRKMVIR
jgi:dolichol-phosphate mannosyltransferase